LKKQFRVNIEFLSLEDADNVVELFHELDKEKLGDELIEFYLENNYRKISKPDLRKIGIRYDILNKKLKEKIEDIHSKAKESKSLNEVLDDLIMGKGWNSKYAKILSEISSEEYYNFFKSQSGNKRLQLYIKKTLEFYPHKNTSSTTTQEQISENVEQALKKIASESKLNKIRIESIYNLKFEHPDSNN